MEDATALRSHAYTDTIAPRRLRADFLLRLHPESCFVAAAQVVLAFGGKMGKYCSFAKLSSFCWDPIMLMRCGRSLEVDGVMGSEAFFRK